MLNTITPSKAEALARAFHQLYEGLAPDFGICPETAVSFDSIPSTNRALMVAVCKILLDNDVVRMDECRHIYPADEMIAAYWQGRFNA